MVFRLSIRILAVLVLAGVLMPDAFGEWTQRIQAATLAGGGWLYLVIVFGVLALLGYLAFSRTGQLRIGGQDAGPQFSRGSWFSMLFSHHAGGHRGVPACCRRVQALQAVVIVAALPFAVLLVAVLLSLYRVLSQDLRAIELQERELHRAELRGLQREREARNDGQPPAA